MSVIFDVQGIQSRAHGERGIARYLAELATALAAHPAKPISRFAVNRELPVPGAIQPLTSRVPVVYSSELPPVDERVYHIGSPIELTVPVSQLLPRAVERLRTVATLYDLIPLRFEDIYLSDPATRRLYETRLGLVRRAERVLAISEQTAADAESYLGVDERRVVVAGTGVADRFRPPSSRSDALAAAQQAFPWLKAGFVLFTGGIEPRKNIDRLLVAYSNLADEIREAHQLVIVCSVQPAEQAALDAKLERMRIRDRVVFPGYIPDEHLILLYQSTELFVFPSVFEGFGLPVGEALACGAPVIASGTSSLLELVDTPEARFDPSSPRAIREALEHFLSTPETRAGLAPGLSERYRWPAVANRTAEAYAELGGKRVPRSRTTRKIAFVTPMPPQVSGVADESFRLIRALSRLRRVDVFVDGPRGPAAPDELPDVAVRPVESFAVADRVSGGYDRVIYALGNSEYHAGALALLRRRPGVVIAHDVRLTGLYAWASRNDPRSLPSGFADALREMYAGRLPVHLEDATEIDFWTANRYGIYMAADAIGWSERFLVHSLHAAQLARLDARAEHADKVGVLPYGVISPAEFDRSVERDPHLVSTFGFVSPTKQTQKLVEAWPFVLRAEPKARLAIVGSDAGSGENARLRRLAERLDVAFAVHQTGDIDEPGLRRWVSRTEVAVQLRAASNGESSAVIARCLAGGATVLVSDLGSAAELPDACSVKVSRDAAPDTLAGAVIALLRDERRRSEMRAAGLRYADANAFAVVARILNSRYLEQGEWSLPLRDR